MFDTLRACGSAVAQGALRLIRSSIVPASLFGLSGYFFWHSTHGERGLTAQAALRVEIEDAQDAKRQAERELQSLERRVSGLRGDRLDRDSLDERARASLGLTGRGEFVIPYPAARRTN